MTNLKLIKKILDNLDTIPDATLEMSYLNCHMSGLHSVVLNNNMGRLTRMFITETTHQMYRNLGTRAPALGIHDHKYDLTLTSIIGNAINVNFTAEKTQQRLGNIKQWVFEDQKPYETMVRDEIIKQSSIEMIDLDGVFIDKDALHTVYVPQGQRAIWLVEEGEEVKKSTRLYTNGSVKIDPLKHYQRFGSANEVRTYVKDLLESMVPAKILQTFVE